jgi:hypothetical protein
MVMGLMLFSGCSSPHGQPRQGSESLSPKEVLEFRTLYSENCAGCHGAEGRGGAAIALADPVYLAIADDAVIRKVIANGVRGTAMPAFAESAGGMLTDKQIDVITGEMRSRWSRQGILNGAPLTVAAGGLACVAGAALCSLNLPALTVQARQLITANFMVTGIHT